VVPNPSPRPFDFDAGFASDRAMRRIEIRPCIPMSVDMRQVLALIRLATSRPHLVVLAFSAAMLVGALLFQFVGGLLPCWLCMWQRWAHLAAGVLALIAAILPWRFYRAVTSLAGTALVVGAGIAVYHVGVENHWWGLVCLDPLAPHEGTIEGLRAALLAAQPVPCDVVQWSLFGISMAGWNALASLPVGLAAAYLALRGTLTAIGRGPVGSR
jgi:disulfide bond formation protein DsbB